MQTDTALARQDFTRGMNLHVAARARLELLDGRPALANHQPDLVVRHLDHHRVHDRGRRAARRARGSARARLGPRRGWAFASEGRGSARSGRARRGQRQRGGGGGLDRGWTYLSAAAFCKRELRTSRQWSQEQANRPAIDREFQRRQATKKRKKRRTKTC